MCSILLFLSFCFVFSFNSILFYSVLLCLFSDVPGHHEAGVADEKDAAKEGCRSAGKHGEPDRGREERRQEEVLLIVLVCTVVCNSSNVHHLCCSLVLSLMSASCPRRRLGVV